MDLIIGVLVLVLGVALGRRSMRRSPEIIEQVGVVRSQHVPELHALVQRNPHVYVPVPLDDFDNEETR